MSKTPPSSESLLKFPCDFTIKVFGESSDEFESEVLRIIHHHVPQFSDQNVSKRPSENGKYLALSITIHVESKLQLDSIYKDLSSSPHVLMTI